MCVHLAASPEFSDYHYDEAHWAPLRIYGELVTLGCRSNVL
jgi:hypothetical protein